MSLAVKAYLELPNGEVEIRRCHIDEGASSNYYYLSEKIARIFPSLSGNSFTMFWKDTEDEKIAFSSDEELMEGLASVGDGIFRIYIHTTGRRTGEMKPHVHPGIVCDGCHGPVIGSRFKCCVCPDFDLCPECEGKGLHDEHAMYRLCNPDGCYRELFKPWKKYMKEAFHNMKYRKRCWKEGEKSRDQPCDKAKGENSGNLKECSSAEECMRNIGEVVKTVLTAAGVDVTVDVEPGNETQDSDKPQEKPQTCPKQRPECGNGWGNPHGWGKPHGWGHGWGRGWGGHHFQGKPWWGHFAAGFPPSYQDHRDHSDKPTCSKDADAAMHEQDKAQENGKHGDTAAPMETTSTNNERRYELMLEETLKQLKAMGFEDDGGWLTSLVQAKGGDLNKVLDALKMRETYMDE